MIIIFAGSIGRFPIGGHAWINLQYLAGLVDLGHKVFYLEDCGAQSWVHDWERDESTTDLVYPTSYVAACLRSIGLEDKWIYRAGDRSEGMPLDLFMDVCTRADLLVLRATPLTLWRPEYSWPRRRIFIDVDPGFTQISLSRRDRALAETVARCERLFTIAQRIGAADCSVPTTGREWLPTLSPVWLPAWPAAQSDCPECFTSIMQWRSYRKGHRYHEATLNGVRFGQKEEEFAACIDLPRRTSQRFRLALTGGPRERMVENGWEVVEGWAATRTTDAYRRFIQQSRAEFSIAKHGYVASRSGWFSDRSVCYLASGRPVLVQDTGLGDRLPLGEGILTFRTTAEALLGVAAINGDYERHCSAARCLAEEYFATGRVLPALLAAID